MCESTAQIPVFKGPKKNYYLQRPVLVLPVEVTASRSVYKTRNARFALLTGIF